MERVFSHMNHLWTDSRNKLSVDMVKAVLCNFSLKCREIHGAVKANKKLLAASVSEKNITFMYFFFFLIPESYMVFSVVQCLFVM